MTTVVAWAAAEQPRMIVAIAVLTKRMIDTPLICRSASTIEWRMNRCSYIGGEGSEIRPDVVNVNAFPALQPSHDGISHRSEDHFPADLQDELTDHHRAKCRKRPIRHPVKGERIKDQAVRAFTNDRAADGARPEILAVGPDLHFREYDRVQKIADEEGGHRCEDDPPSGPEDPFIGRLPGPALGDRQMDHRPFHHGHEEQRRE